MKLFKNSELRKIEKLETTKELKDLLVLFSMYKQNLLKQLRKQEKEQKKMMERQFNLESNVSYGLLKDVETIILIGLTDIKKLESNYIKYFKQYDKVKELFEQTELVNFQLEILALASSLKELNSMNSWKRASYKQLFNDSLKHVSEIDNRYYHEILLNTKHRKQVLSNLKERLEFYNYFYETIENMNDLLKSHSRDFLHVQKNVSYLIKELKKEQ